MKDVRPATWVLLGVLLLFIFAPLFFIDVDGLRAPANNTPDEHLQPSVPMRPSVPDANSAPADEASPPNNEAEPPVNRGPQDN